KSKSLSAAQRPLAALPPAAGNIKGGASASSFSRVQQHVPKMLKPSAATSAGQQRAQSSKNLPAQTLLPPELLRNQDLFSADFHLDDHDGDANILND
ncbi:unnamed protein product, partial [Amoebophrya sp. A120]